MDIFGNIPTIGKLKNEQGREYDYSATDEPRDVLENEENKPAFVFFYVIIFIFALILSFRLLNLQIVHGQQYQYIAEGNRIRTRSIEAPRGLIYDKNNQIIASSISSFSLDLYPADLPKDRNEREKIYEQLNINSQIGQEELTNKINQIGLYSLEPIVLKENISRDEALLLKVKYANMPGVVVTAKPIRQYENTQTLSHFLGYVGKITQEELDKNNGYTISDDFGKSGLEQVYEKYLKGKNGQDQMEVNSKGQVQRILSTNQPQSGDNITLTIDLDLQKKITEILSNVAGKSTKRGVVVAMDPQTGGILAMVSLPAYDNNIFSQPNFNDEYKKLLDDPEKPLINRATSGLYPSGSTIKPFMAAAGLQEGIISENTTINDTGEIKVGSWSFPDWKVHGLTDIRKAIAQSCDVFFYAVGGGWDKIRGLGLKKIDEYLAKFGFGAKTGIDLPSEEKGLVPDADWKKKVKKEAWYIGDTYHLSIGQGDFLSTPLQLLNATSVIANGGKLLQPHFVDKINAPDGSLVQQINTQVIRENFINSDVMQIVREGMRQTVIDGSGRLLNDLVDKNGNPIEASGKTGTAQFGSDDQTHSWFTSYAPYNNPSIALVVLVEGGGEGNESALPVAKDILQYWFNK